MVLNFLFNWMKERQKHKKNVFGHAERDGRIIFFVQKKEDESQLARKDILPRFILWKRCSVEQQSIPKAQAINLDRQIQRYGSPYVGTAGMVVTMNMMGNLIFSRELVARFPEIFESFGILPQKFILTNMHVAHENLTPAASDTYGQPNNFVASLRAFQFFRGDAEKDCALLRPITERGHDWAHVYDKDYIVRDPTLGNEVEKTGRSTNFTTGIITHKKVNVAINYGAAGTIIARDAFMVRGLNNKPFSKKGDSGSVVFEKGTNKVIGLLFAGNDDYSIIYPIKDVFKKLHIY